jgi:TolA-binding protein
MKTPPNWPARLADAGPDPGHEAAARAGELLRALSAPPPLSAAALARIDARLRAAQESGAARAPSRRRAPIFAALGVAAAGAAAALLLFTRPAPGPRPDAVAGTAQGTPGLVERMDRRLSIESGRLRVQAGQGEVVVAVPGGQVVVRGEAEIEVRQRGAVRVASYAGGATLSWGGRTIEVAAGSAWSTEEAVEPQAQAGPPPATEPAPPPATGPAAEKESRPQRPRRQAADASEPGPRPSPSPGPGPGSGPAEAGAAGPAAAGGAESALFAESQLLSEALRLLHREGDPQGALALLLSHAERFPRGTLRPEAQGAQVEALLRLGRRAEALRLLDRLPINGLPRADELRLLRGELRMEAGRCAEAIADFSSVLDGDRQGGAGERALYGRASCRARQGDRAGARADLLSYLARYPSGKFSDEAREALGK